MAAQPRRLGWQRAVLLGSDLSLIRTMLLNALRVLAQRKEVTLATLEYCTQRFHTGWSLLPKFIPEILQALHPFNTKKILFQHVLKQFFTFVGREEE